MKSIYRMSDAQPDWAETDPSQPDYIKNKQLVERFRPIIVDGEVYLNEGYDSGSLQLASGPNISLKINDDNVLIISATNTGDEDYTQYLAGQGIVITENDFGQFVVSIDNNYLNTFVNDIVTPQFVQLDEKYATLAALDGVKQSVNEVINSLDQYRIKTDTTLDLVVEAITDNAAEILLLQEGTENLKSIVNNNSIIIKKLQSQIDIGDITISNYVADQISQFVIGNIPIATDTTVGGIKSSDSIRVAPDGTASVEKISIDAINQDETTLVLYGGDANNV